MVQHPVYVEEIHNCKYVILQTIKSLPKVLKWCIIDIVQWKKFHKLNKRGIYYGDRMLVVSKTVVARLTRVRFPPVTPIKSRR